MLLTKMKLPWGAVKAAGVAVLAPVAVLSINVTGKSRMEGRAVQRYYVHRNLKVG